MTRLVRRYCEEPDSTDIEIVEDNEHYAFQIRTTGGWFINMPEPPSVGYARPFFDGERIFAVGGYGSYNTSTRIYVASFTVGYADATVLIATDSNLSSDVMTEIMNNIEIRVGNAWIVKNGLLEDYETYVGDGTTWQLFKEAA